jgi:hypothetical protein
MLSFMAVFTFISVGYLDNGEEVVVSLDQIRQHCRAERVDELLADLGVLCQDVVSEWDQREPSRPVLAMIRGSAK